MELIVCETTHKWAVALRRQLHPELAGSMRETRSLDECWQEAAASPACVVILELTGANLERCARELLKYRAHLPRAVTVVVASRGISAASRLMRELGALHVVCSSRQLGPVLRIIERYREQLGASNPVAPWRRLPWGQGVTGRREFGHAGPLVEPGWLWPDR